MKELGKASVFTSQFTPKGAHLVVDVMDIVESQKIYVQSKNRGRASYGCYRYCGTSKSISSK